MVIAMSDSRFSRAVVRKLKAAGWEEGRQVDVGPVLDDIRRRGVECNHAAEEVLREFYGLKWNLPRGGISFLEFDNAATFRFLHVEDLGRVRRLVGEPVCPVASGGGFIVLVAPSGRVALLQDEWLCLLRADSLTDAFEFIFNHDTKAVENVPLSDDQRPPAFRGA
jgi:hypothetical protein